MRSILKLLTGAARVLACLVLAALTAAGVAWIAVHPDYTVGLVSDSQPVAGSDQVVLALDAPVGEAHLVLGSAGASRAPRGSWVVARGERTALEQGSVLHGPQLFAVPAVADLLSAGGLLPRLHPGLVVLAGALVLYLGLIVVRSIGALALGLVLGALAWHGAALLGLEGVLPVSDLGLAASAASAFALGALVGWRSRGMLGFCTQRTALIALVLSLAPAVEAQFGWSPTLTRAVLVVATLVGPSIALMFTAATLMAVGLGVGDLISHGVLGASAMATEVATRGRWLPGRAWSKRASGRGAVTVEDLVREDAR